MADLQQQQEPEYDFLLAEARSITDTSLKDERLAKQLDDRLGQIQGIPAGYLSTRRMMGELRNPYGGRFVNTSVQMALIKAATYGIYTHAKAVGEAVFTASEEDVY
jgi:hypothetical protein